jgi:DNA-binding GntR family transcriptional regulator
VEQIAASTLGDQAYNAILDAIASGELAAGTKVTERGLADLLGVSPTPVREALQRLVLDGRVQRAGPRTLRVASVPQEALAEADEIEIELQVLAVRLAVRKATDDDVKRLTARLEALGPAVAKIAEQADAGQAPDSDLVRHVLDGIRAFHDDVRSIAANEMLARLLEQARTFSLVDRQRAAQTLTRASISGTRRRYPDHAELVAAIAAGDEDRAAAIQRRHSASSRRDLHRVV